MNSPTPFQHLDLIERFTVVIGAVNINEYIFKSPQNASIGAHLRHCIDFATALERDFPQKKIDYDDRERSDLLETNPQFALMALSEKFHALNLLAEKNCLNTSLTIVQSSGQARPPVEMQSNLLRELIYVQDHALHHLAIIQSIAHSLGKKIPRNLVENYSTKKFYSSQSAHD